MSSPHPMTMQAAALIEAWATECRSLAELRVLALLRCRPAGLTAVQVAEALSVKLITAYGPLRTLCARRLIHRRLPIYGSGRRGRVAASYHVSP